jgi:hypothetical protein
MTTQGIEGIVSETHDWGRAVRLDVEVVSELSDTH